jgi:hypothetical protein
MMRFGATLDTDVWCAIGTMIRKHSSVAHAIETIGRKKYRGDLHGVLSVCVGVWRRLFG